MSYGQVNADVIGTSVANSSLGAGNATLMKNKIINGACVIDQRNAGASVTQISADLVFPVDRTNIYGSVTSKFTAQQNAGSVTPPVGFVNYLGCTSSSAYTVGSSDSFWVQQRIEGYNVADLQWGTANAKTVTLSFWVRSSLTGTFGGSFQNSASDRSYPFTYTISSANTWEQKSVTVAGDTTGTWLTTNGVGIKVSFGLGSGSTVSNTAGAWVAGNYTSATGATSVVGTNGATYYITGVQLEVGSSATGFEYVNYQTSLANCQRYYQRLNSNGNRDFNGYIYNNSLIVAQFQLPVPMRAAPATLDTTGTAANYAIYYTSTNTNCASVPAINAAGANFICLTAVPNASLSGINGQGIALGGTTTSAYYGFSAEL